MPDDFVHLHVHSEYSLLDGLGRIGQLTARAVELGQPALALTDHGTMHGAIEFVRAARKAGVKPLLGVEAYLTRYGRPMGGRDPEQDRNRHHLLLLAENMTGYRNLLQICSSAQMDGYYYRPRIDADYLAAHSEGLICTSGCLSAELPTLLKNGQDAKAVERLQWYRDVFGPERWYIEFQEHDIPELTDVNKRLFQFARQYDIPIVVTNDVHYVREEDAIPHDMLLCVQTSALVSQQDRMRMSSPSYFLKSAAQMRQTFLPLADLPDSAYTNTVKIAEMCDVDPEDGTYHLPDIAIPEGFTYQSYLRTLTEEGLRERYSSHADDPAVQARTEHELKIIHEMGFDVYYLIVWDLTRYARQRNIWYNVRGSGAGSIVAYAIGITNLDPLRNKLIFERFLNPGRVTMPDFDLDFPDDQREELIRYTVDKFGSEQVAQIVTFGRMKARAAVRDVGRAMDVPLPEVDRIAKMIPAIPGKPVTIQEVLTEGHEFYSAELRDLYQGQDYVKSLLDTASQLEGVARHSSIHAAAVVVADRPLVNYTPLMRPPKSAVTEKITQYEYPILESIGLLKIDFLGLATLSLMRETVRLIKERHGIEFTLQNLPIDDPKIYELLTSGDVMGVFQVEGQGMRRVLMDLRPDKFEHIVATISLYRPGPMEFIPDYIAVLHGEKKPQYVHKVLAPILEESMGVCIYQEQVIQILTDVAGYTAGEADLVRRGISKKSKKTMDEHREIFARGAARVSGLTRAEADEVWDALMGFARYGFNRAHAADYAVIVAQTAFLKAYYPAEYMAALLTIERHDTEKVGVLIAECRRMGIEVLPPSVNVSSNGFTIEQLPPDRPAPKKLSAFPFPVPENAAIRMGLDAIKNVGEGPVEGILRGRGIKAFVSLADFADRVDLRQINRRGVECLIKVGALSDYGERGQLLAAVDRIMGASTRAHEAREVGQFNLFGDLPDADEEDLLRSLTNVTKVSPKEALEWEKELVGVYVSSHPLQTMTAELINVVTHSTAELTEELGPAAVVIAGMITDIRQITTKKGDPMAFVHLEDLQGSIEVTVFPKLFQATRQLWATDKIVIVSGKTDVRNGRVSVLADSVRDYVEGMTVIEDTSSVAYRYRNGGLPGTPRVRELGASLRAAASPAREQPGSGYGATQAAPAGRPAVAGGFGAPGGFPGTEDNEGRYFGDENPFAAEEPDWMDGEPGTGQAGPSEASLRLAGGGSSAALARQEHLPAPAKALREGGAVAPDPAPSPVLARAVPQPSDREPVRPATPASSSAAAPAGLQRPAASPAAPATPVTPGSTIPAPLAAGGPSSSPAPVQAASSGGAGASRSESQARAEPPAAPAKSTPSLTAGAAENAQGSLMLRGSSAGPAAAPGGPRTLRVTFRRSQSLEGDRHRLSELVELLSRFQGEDRFVIVVEAAGIARYQLDFPNNFTRVCRELQQELVTRLGTGSWTVS